VPLTSIVSPKNSGTTEGSGVRSGGSYSLSYWCAYQSEPGAVFRPRLPQVGSAMLMSGPTKILSCTTSGSSWIVVPPSTLFSMNSGSPRFFRLISKASRRIYALAMPA
jgi:hypothetical protein